MSPLIEDFGEVLAAAKAGQEWAVASLYDALQPPLLSYLTWREPSAAPSLSALVPKLSGADAL